jgi:Immunoglobulin I-set domain
MKVRITDMRQPRSALRRSISLLMAVALVAVLVSAGIATTIAGPVQAPAFVSGAPAAFVPPTSTQFDVTGFLQAASLDSTCAADAHCGGSLTVDGHVVVVPKETIVILPANALTWQELFAQAPAPYGLATVPPSTGLAVADAPVPPYTYEVHAVGNRQGDTYIAGLVSIAQQGLNSGAGYINFINYATGEFRVGGTIGSSTTGQRVQLNDPTGRYGRIVTPDKRFTVDADNPTVTAATGYPMCIPREDPTTVNADGTVGDVLCPQGNRPGDGTGNFAISIQTNDPRVPCTDTVNLLPAGCSLTGVGPDLFPRARDQAPMEVGDYVTYGGTLVNDTNGSYISAHTVTNNTAVYTWPGTNPAYVLTDTTLIGTGGLTVIGATEATIRTRFEGMTTDPSRGIHLYGIDLDPITGATTDRDWGTIGVDPGPPNGAVKGRWRFRPPCDPFGTIETKPDKKCVMNQAGTFLPPTREVRAVIEGLQSQNPANPAALTSANGLFYGQYHAPITDYIFPENIPGSPIIPNNFEAIDFLACGGYASSTGVIARQLNPWPGTTAPTCTTAATAPVATVGANQVVTSGAAVTLTGSATGNPVPTLAWTQTDVAPTPLVTLAGTTTTSATFTAPTVSATTVLNFTLTATNSAGTSTASMTVTVNPPVAPVANAGPNQTVPSGSAVTLSGTATGATPITFSWAQATTDATQVVLSGANTATATFTAPFVSALTVLNFTLTATNTSGTSTASMTVTVNADTAPTVNSIPNVSILSGATGSFTVSGSDPNVPQALPLTFAATQSGTPALVSLTTTQGPVSPGTGATVSFQAPTLPAGQTTSSVITVSVTATNQANLTSAPQTMTITVLPAQAPTVNAISPVSVFSGAAGSFAVSGADPNLPALTPLTFAATQTGTPALVGLSVGSPTTSTSATVKFTAPTLPVGQVTSSTVTVSVTATNTAGLVSAPVSVTVTIKPLPDTVTILTAVYRTSKQRLDMTASSSVVSTNVILTLQPYLTTAGKLFTPPSGTFTNAGNGSYTITLVGAPQPAAGNNLVVKSNLGGVSAPFNGLSVRK